MAVVTTLRGVTPGYESSISAYGAGYHLGHHFKTGADVRKITKIRTYYTTNGTSNSYMFTFLVLKRSTQVNVWESAQITATRDTTWRWYSADLSLTLEANTEYVLVMWNQMTSALSAPNSTNVLAANKDNGVVDAGGITWNQFTSNDAGYAALADTSYSNDGAYEMGFEVTHQEPNALPTAPTNLAVAQSDVHMSNTLPVTYQHNDAEGDPQAKTQARWRKVIV